MAAVSPATTSQPSRGRSLKRAVSRSTEDSLQQQNQDAHFRPAPVKTTELQTGDDEMQMLASQKEDGATGLKRTQPEQSVDAVVNGISVESVMLNCRSPTGTIEIQVPISLVPDELRLFGQPVKFLLVRRDGYRVPVVMARAAAAVSRIDGEDEIDSWVNQL